MSAAYDLYLLIQEKEKLSVDSLEERYSILKQLNAPLTYERYIWYRYRYILIISDALAGLLLENKNQPTSLALILNHWSTIKAHNPNDVAVQQIDENLESLIGRFQPSHGMQPVSSHVPLTVSTTKEISEFEPEIPFAEQHAIAFASNIIKACDPFNIVECFKVMISAMPYADSNQVITAIHTISHPFTKWLAVSQSIAFVFMVHLRMAHLKDPIKSFPFAPLLLPDHAINPSKLFLQLLSGLSMKEILTNLATALAAPIISPYGKMLPFYNSSTPKRVSPSSFVTFVITIFKIPILGNHYLQISLLITLTHTSPTSSSPMSSFIINQKHSQYF